MNKSGVSLFQSSRRQGSGPVRAPLALRSIRLIFRVLGPLAPGLMARLGRRLWFTPRRTRIPTYQRTWLAGAEEAYTLAFGSHQIAVYAWGKGPVVLLVHGWEGRAGQLGGFVEPLVARGFRVVAFDAPAHGASSGRQTDGDEVARLISRLVQREGKLCAVVAHSFGAMVCAYALSKGISVERAVFISPPADLELLVRVFREQLQVPRAVWAPLKRLVEARFTELGPRVWTRFATVENVRKFAFPGLVIHDRHDPLIPFSKGALVQEAWSSSRLITTRGLGHHRILRDPGVIGSVADWIASAREEPMLPAESRGRNSKIA